MSGILSGDMMETFKTPPFNIPTPVSHLITLPLNLESFTASDTGNNEEGEYWDRF